MSTLTAMQKFEADCDVQREKMYGPNWRDLNWYGQPLSPVQPQKIRRKTRVQVDFMVAQHGTLDKIGTGCV